MRKRIPIFLGMILVALAMWLLITPTRFIHAFMERLDNLGYDLQLRTWIFTRPTYELAPVAIIDIDDKSLKEIGRWPWPRSLLANLINKLSEDGAAVIAFDIFFTEEQANIAQSVIKTLNKNNVLLPQVATSLKQHEPLFDEDALLAQSLAKSQSVLAIGFLPRKQTQNTLPPPLLTLTQEQSDELQIITAAGFISSIPELQAVSKGSGFINIFPDSDGIIRRTTLLIEYQRGIYPALSLQAVLLFLGDKIKLITPSYGTTDKLEGIRIGNLVIPTDAKGQVLIPFIGRSYTFPYFSAVDVLKNKIPTNALAGKILFIGTSATGLGDLHPTAIQTPFPGVEIQASLVNGILQNDFSYKPAWTFGANVFLTLLFGILAAFIFPYLGPRISGLTIILLPTGLLFLNNAIWRETGLILSFLVPTLLVAVIALLNILYGYLFETRRREHLKEMFGQYVPKKHIDEMLKTSSDYALRGEDREMSVLFADIRNFTSISENMPAAELVALLNTYFTPMTEIIFQHRGTIDKYVGDLIMAFWGAPLRDKHHARHAIESALEMQKKLQELQTEFSAHHYPEIQMGIGINSGMMSVGDMGSRYRRNYTVLGDAVNLASRIESLTKFYGVKIIVTEITHTDQTRFVFRKLDRVRVKGKIHGIDIYEVICYQNELTPELTEELTTYHEALNAYQQQKWDEALTILQNLQKAHPHKLYQIYIDRIMEYKQHPAPADWDGVFVHAEK